MPSFIVRLDSQKHIDFSLKSPFGGEFLTFIFIYIFHILASFTNFLLKVAGLAALRGRTPRRVMTLALTLTSKLLRSGNLKIKALIQGRKIFAFFSC